MTTDTNRPGPAAAALTEERQAQRRQLTEAVRANYRHELSIPYGSHPKQVLDIYYPNAVNTGNAVPVLVFLHGGGFRGGAPGPMGFVGKNVLGHGAMFISMGYRLIPDAPFPDSCDDVELGLHWLRENVAQRGGDPDRIYLSGHSAGASLAASVALRPFAADPDLPEDLIKGLLVFSGFYDREQPAEDHNTASPRYIQQLTKSIERVPAMTIAVSADSDFPTAPENADALVAAIKARGGAAERFTQPNADHFAAINGMTEEASPVFQAVRKMMQLD
jgi:acetyl esterase/lipase